MTIYVIAAAFIAIDFVTGLIKAVAKNTFKSSIMRQGLYHKISELLCMCMGILIDFAQGYLDLGINVPVGTAVCCYIVLMEIGSALENLCAINPELSPTKLKTLFGMDTKEEH